MSNDSVIGHRKCCHFQKSQTELESSPTNNVHTFSGARHAPFVIHAHISNTSMLYNLVQQMLLKCRGDMIHLQLCLFTQANTAKLSATLYQTVS